MPDKTAAPYSPAGTFACDVHGRGRAATRGEPPVASEVADRRLLDHVATVRRHVPLGPLTRAETQRARRHESGHGRDRAGDDEDDTDDTPEVMTAAEAPPAQTSQRNGSASRARTMNHSFRQRGGSPVNS